MDANLFTAYNYLSSAIAQAFAALALAWTVCVVIKMLGEPEEPQGAKSSQPTAHS